MSMPTVVVFAMTEVGHFQRLYPLIAGLSGMDAQVHVFTDRRFRGAVEEAGGTFVDMLGRYPLSRVDEESVPFPCRFVTFAGHYAEEIAAEVEAIGPSLIVCDTFAVIGRVVARLLDLPHVNVCNGHNLEPRRTMAELKVDQPQRISPDCERAVELLRGRYGMSDASPYSYLDGISPLLNVYCEPPAFLSPGERAAFEPIAFHGSLPPPESIESPPPDACRDLFPADAELKVYASFGTVIWRYWPGEALRALTAISDAVERRAGASALLSLGGFDVGDAARRRLERPRVSVEAYVDQWRALTAADAVITHNGLNSTHEAIFCEVPMVSYPFFGDQPSLARRCWELGVAVPMVEEPRGALDEGAVHRALDELTTDRQRMIERLATARSWELETIAGRPAVWERVIALAKPRTPAAR